MNKKRENSCAVKERVLIVDFDDKDFQQPQSESDFSEFSQFCKSRGLVYEKRSQWQVELDKQQEIPQIRDAFQKIEYNFKCMDSSSPDQVKYVFRIMQNQIIFNYLTTDSCQNDSIESTVKEFSPLWESFKKNFSLPNLCKIALSYAINLNRDTLYKDESLFRTNWLEVNEISSLFGRINKFPFESQYLHPFSCYQRWLANHPILDKIVLACKTGSLLEKNKLTLQFLLQVNVIKPYNCTTAFQWHQLFESLSNLRNVILEDKALRATEEDWK